MRIHRNRKSRPAEAEALVRARGNLVAKSGARMSGRSLNEMSLDELARLGEKAEVGLSITDG